MYCGSKNDDKAINCCSCNANDFYYLCNNCHTRFSSPFCPKCGLKAGDTGKVCPKCGSNYYSVSCPDCGYNPNRNINISSNNVRVPLTHVQPEIPNTKNYFSCKELCDKLDEIEASRPRKGFLSNFSDKLSKVWRSSSSLEPTDQRKIEAISSFVIPNIKSEIIDFIMLSDSKMETCEMLMETSNDSYVCEVQESLLEIWAVKQDEALKKGDAMLANDNDYLKIRWTIMSQKYMTQGLCKYCGGRFKGVIKQVCVNCGRRKDY